MEGNFHVHPCQPTGWRLSGRNGRQSPSRGSLPTITSLGPANGPGSPFTQQTKPPKPPMSNIGSTDAQLCWRLDSDVAFGFADFDAALLQLLAGAG